LADEPTGNLDAKTGETIHDLLISLNRDDGITAVIVTHNMKLAERLSRQVTLIDGRAVPVD
jgi:predicted ABC-type transport system involved in lysophospholipase L1 biosynthesis ATPase subunit